MEVTPMKAFSIIAKIIAALAAAIGAIYVLATYGDKIVAWCKNVIDSLPECSFCDDDDEDIEVEIEIDEEPVVEEPEIEELVEEVAAEEVAEAVDAVVADDADFEA
jgi:hypothetical protein